MAPDPTAVNEIDPQTAGELARAGAVLLDVREDDEWRAGHSPDAQHMAMGSVAERIDEIPTDRTVVCVCRVGGRSGAVAGALAEAGYDVRNMGGGMLAWESAGLPVVTDSGAVGQII